nr:hypothetical protein [Streptomyces sp. I5]
MEAAATIRGGPSAHAASPTSGTSGAYEAARPDSAAGVSSRCEGRQQVAGGMVGLGGMAQQGAGEAESRPSEWWASVRVSTHGSAENGSGPDGTLTKDVAASGDIVVRENCLANYFSRKS